MCLGYREWKAVEPHFKVWGFFFKHLQKINTINQVLNNYRARWEADTWVDLQETGNWKVILPKYMSENSTEK